MALTLLFVHKKRLLWWKKKVILVLERSPHSVGFSVFSMGLKMIKITISTNPGMHIEMVTDPDVQTGDLVFVNEKGEHVGKLTGIKADK